MSRIVRFTRNESDLEASLWLALRMKVTHRNSYRKNLAGVLAKNWFTSRVANAFVCWNTWKRIYAAESHVRNGRIFAHGFPSWIRVNDELESTARKKTVLRESFCDAMVTVEIPISVSNHTLLSLLPAFSHENKTSKKLHPENPQRPTGKAEKLKQTKAIAWREIFLIFVRSISYAIYCDPKTMHGIYSYA